MEAINVFEIRVERCRPGSVENQNALRYLVDGSRTFIVDVEQNRRARNAFKWKFDITSLNKRELGEWCHEQWGDQMFEPLLIRDTYGPDQTYHHYARWAMTHDWLYFKTDAEFMMFKLAWA